MCFMWMYEEHNIVPLAGSHTWKVWVFQPSTLRSLNDPATHKDIRKQARTFAYGNHTNRIMPSNTSKNLYVLLAWATSRSCRSRLGLWTGPYEREKRKNEHTQWQLLAQLLKNVSLPNLLWVWRMSKRCGAQGEPKASPSIPVERVDAAIC